MNKNKIIKDLEEKLKHSQEMNCKLMSENEKLRTDKSYISDAIITGLTSIKINGSIGVSNCIGDVCRKIDVVDKRLHDEKERLAYAYDLSQELEEFKNRKYKDIIFDEVDGKKINPFELSDSQINYIHEYILKAKEDQRIFNDGFNEAVRLGNKAKLRK